MKSWHSLHTQRTSLRARNQATDLQNARNDLIGPLWSRTRAPTGEAPLSADSDFNWTESADPDRKLVKSADEYRAFGVCRNWSESADSTRLQTQTNIYILLTILYT